MPYKNTSDLPEAVKNVLPKHAQEIYLKSFNNAWSEYKESEKRQGGEQESREEVSHKVAWSAVKKKYEKRDDKWIEK